MIKDKSYSAYILPIRNGKVALLRYGKDGYGPIGGWLDDGEKFKDALRCELTEELGEQSLKMLDLITEIPVAYSFKHTDPQRAEKHGTWSEEHHYFISYETENLDLTFCEIRAKRY